MNKKNQPLTINFLIPSTALISRVGYPIRLERACLLWVYAQYLQKIAHVGCCIQFPTNLRDPKLTYSRWVPLPIPAGQHIF